MQECDPECAASVRLPLALFLTGALLFPALLWAADRVAVEVIVSDALARPGRVVRVESRLLRTGILGSQGAGGERLTLSVGGAEMAGALTGGDGVAFLEFEPKRLGLVPMKVSVAGSTRVLDAAGEGWLAVWEKRRPLLLVESAVLFAPSVDSSAPGRGPIALPVPTQDREVSDRQPVPEAAEELNRLGKFFYNIVYLIPAGPHQGIQRRALHEWLLTHHFPAGVVLPAPPTLDGLTGLLGQMKSDGWENVRAGVGRTTVFAQALVGQRLKTAIVAGDVKGEYPRKARLVSDWKAVRKHLQD